jgi:hypothetical protein
MLTSVRAIVKDGQITLLEPVDIPEGTEVLVTLLEDQDRAFWNAVTERSLTAVWDHPDDDVYAELLPE